MGRRLPAWLVLGVVGLSTAGCIVSPHPLTDAERGDEVATDRTAMFANQERLDHPLTLQEAFARALKYNLDNRVKLMETAVAQHDFDLSRYDLLPKLTAQAGYFGRSNVNASSSQSVSTGQQSLVQSTSQDRFRDTAGLTLSFNILDFGVSYYTARQQADRMLIVDEQRRRVIENLLQDVRGAFWRAASDQLLGPDLDASITVARSALDDSRKVEAQRLRAPIEALRFQKVLLDSLTEMQFLRQRLQEAKIELAALINLPPGENFTIAVPAESTMTVVPITVPLERMEEIALMRNPDLRGQSYQARISAAETRKALLKLLPGISLSGGPQYDSNSFLYNKRWEEGAAQLGWNLMSLVSYPEMRRAAQSQKELSEMRRQALSVAVLAKIHIVYQQYQSAGRDYAWSAERSEVDTRLYKMISDRANANAQADLERIAAQVSAITSRLRQYQSYADEQMALGRLYATMGLDAMPGEAGSLDIAGLSDAMGKAMTDWQNGRFLSEAARQPQETPSSDAAPAVTVADAAPAPAPTEGAAPPTAGRWLKQTFGSLFAP